MQAGKYKSQIFATCRLRNQTPKILATCRMGNSKPKSLLHAGWKIKTPNPCYMQVGKSKPLILAACKLGKSNLKHLILATCRLRVQNPHIFATRRLGNQPPPPFPIPLLKALKHAGREIKPQILVTGRLGNQTQNLCYMQAGKFTTPNPCYISGWGSKSLKSLLHASWEIRHPSPRPLQIFAT